MYCLQSNLSWEMGRNYYIENAIEERMALSLYRVGCCRDDDGTFGKVAALGLRVETTVDADDDNGDKHDLDNLNYG